uniref:Carboxylesterase type B domain-containing protein n=1 Tax=Plectus sambesii TaxID=2011161 RepID=A0A914WGX5_9BILA
MLKFSPLLLLLGALSVSEGQKNGTEWTKVTLGTGAIRGRRVVTASNTTAILFQGVPFAEPPTGDLRYRAPVDKKKWDGELDTTAYKAACMSSRKFDIGPQKSWIMSEDCLHANVFTTEKCLDEKNCPVLYYIFGGAWNFNSPFTLNDELIIENFNSKNVVLVTINYRLGSFGFINTGNRTSAVKNLGLLDMIQGLRWTQREIGNFGGDKGKVTLMGHSNGAVAADMISISPKTGGLFHQVILMSGPAGMHELPLDNNVARTKALAVNVGCATDDLWNADSIEKIITCMRNKTADELISVQKKMEDNGDIFYGPMMDESDGVLPERIDELQRKRRPYRMLIGTTNKEFRSSKKIIDKDGKINRQSLYTTCVKQAKNHGFKHPNVIGRACASEYSQRPDDIPDLDDDLLIYVPTYYTGETMRHKDATVYKYSFEEEKIGGAFGNAKKALGKESPFHGEDLVYVMGYSLGNFTAKDQRISQIYSGIFADFIRTGDPSPPYNDKWEPTDDRNNYFKIKFDDSLTMPGNTNGYHANAVQFWTKAAPDFDNYVSKWDVNGTFSYRKFADELIQGLKQLGMKVNPDLEKEIEDWKNNGQGWSKDRVERFEQMLDDLMHRLQDANYGRRNVTMTQNMNLAPQIREETIVVGTNWRMWFWVVTGVAIVLAVILVLVCCSTCYEYSKRRQYERITETTILNPSAVKTYG